jgi:hypothetical protein
MKTFILIPAILILTFKFSISQTNIYHPFPEADAIWIGTSWYNDGGSGPCVVDDDYNLYIAGDTTIGIYTYHKLYRNGYISANCPPPGHYYFGQYWAAFRQDIANKKVYLFLNGIDSLAYDFNLNEGDTLPLTCVGGFSDNHVESIDSLLIGSKYHKRFWISSGGSINYTALIEGIGTTLGAFASVNTPFEAGDDLWCARINDEIVWTSSPEYACSLTLVQENIITENKTVISPNPFQLITTIRTDQILVNANLSVYNSFGHNVIQINKIFGQTITLNRDNLPCGLYFSILTQNGKILKVDKLIITDN